MVTLDHVLISDTEEQDSDRFGGYGTSVRNQAHVVLRFVRFERNRYDGARVDSLGWLEIEDGVIADTRTSSRGERGRAVSASARVRLLRTELLRNRDLAIHAGADADVELTHVRIADTLPRDCGTDCGGLGGEAGHGI